MGWCYSVAQGWGEGLKYWTPILAPQKPREPHLSRKPTIILAGFMSEHRGLTWDRKSRRGIK